MWEIPAKAFLILLIEFLTLAFLNSDQLNIKTILRGLRRIIRGIKLKTRKLNEYNISGDITYHNEFNRLRRKIKSDIDSVYKN